MILFTPPASPCPSRLAASADSPKRSTKSTSSSLCSLRQLPPNRSRCSAWAQRPPAGCWSRQGDNPERLRLEAVFAALCGAAPAPASSGRTDRHRLSRGGDRQASAPSHDRSGSYALLPSHPVLRRATRPAGTDEVGHHSLPQALHRPGGLLSTSPALAARHAISTA
ncbi:transposase [Streptomyces sp. NPDC085466]|uniref:transposase n=1 Tax=Streptomyces sp. NPDC085466 TaxID=3365725 RepID=UPI0037D550A1